MDFFLTDHQLLEELLQAASNTPAQQLPRLLGRLSEATATAQARLLSPTPAPPVADELLDVKQTCALLHISKSYLYRHHFPFEKRLGRRRLYSRAGVQAYINRNINQKEKTE